MPGPGRPGCCALCGALGGPSSLCWFAWGGWRQLVTVCGAADPGGLAAPVAWAPCGGYERQRGGGVSGPNFPQK